jgi:hypothetical protein
MMRYPLDIPGLFKNSFDYLVGIRFEIDKTGPIQQIDRESNQQSNTQYLRLDPFRLTT